MKFKILISTLIIVPLTVSFLAIYAMTQMTIQHLVSCSSGDGGTLIPANACNFYMENYRITPQDLSNLRNSSGLEYILNSTSKNKYEIATIFIKKGLQVDGENKVSDLNSTPLYSSVLYNDLDMAIFLLGNGADPELENSSNGISPIELAKRLHNVNDSNDRTLLISELLKHIKTSKSEQ